MRETDPTPSRSPGPTRDDAKLLEAEIERHPYPLTFATVSGAHLYGFPSPDSDVDLRGAHVLPLRFLVGLEQPRETVEVSHVRGGREIDLVTHDVGKFFRMLLKKNGYVLEQLYSPLVVHTTPEHEELKAIAEGCITRHHVHHYRGFAHRQWDLFLNSDVRRVKPLLYVYRVLLTGIHLMRTGRIEADLRRLNEEFELPFLEALMERKRLGERVELGPEDEVDFHRREFARWLANLEEAGERSRLPEAPTAAPALDDLLIRIRLETESES